MSATPEPVTARPGPSAPAESLEGADPFSLQRYGLKELASRRGAKWCAAPAGAVAAWVADMDFPVAPAIRRSLITAIASDDLGYASQDCYLAVRQAYARRLSDRHGLLTKTDDVVLTTDVVQFMLLGIETLTEPGDGVLFLTPTYPPFFTAVTATRRRPVTFDFSATANGYRLDLEALKALCRRERPRCLLLCNPHNPTGRVLDRSELDALAMLVEELDLVVISDEIHADLTLPGALHVPIATLGPDIARRTVTVTSASKAFNIAGLHCAAAAFGSPELRARFERVPELERGAVNSLGLLAVLAAFAEGDEWLAQVLAVLDSNRQVVADWASSVAGVSHHRPEATYLAWFDLRARALGDDPAQLLATRANVMLSSGPTFGEAGRGHVRLNFATSRPVLDELLARLGEALRG